MIRRIFFAVTAVVLFAALTSPRQVRAEEQAYGRAQRRADQRCDDRLVADHAARLTAGHADRAQHADLTRALDD